MSNLLESLLVRASLRFYWWELNLAPLALHLKSATIAPCNRAEAPDSGTVDLLRVYFRSAEAAFAAHRAQFPPPPPPPPARPYDPVADVAEWVSAAARTRAAALRFPAGSYERRQRAASARACMRQAIALGMQHGLEVVFPW